MSLVNFIILLSILQYGHCLTLTLEDLENWKKLMKAELKQEIFLELPETEEIKRINLKIHEVTKGNEEIITVVQSHSITLDSHTQFTEKFNNLNDSINSYSDQVIAIKADVDEIKMNQNETLLFVNEQIEELENELDGLEVNQNETIQSQSTVLREFKNELNGFTDQLNDVANNMENKASKAQLQDLKVNKFKICQNKSRILDSNSHFYVAGIELKIPSEIYIVTMWLVYDFVPKFQICMYSIVL